MEEKQQLLPKWIMKRYLLLWKEFGGKQFEFDDALRVLEKLEKPDDKKIVALFLSNLRKAGWVTAALNPQDNRKRFYHLKSYHDLFDRVTEESVARRGTKK